MRETLVDRTSSGFPRLPYERSTLGYFSCDPPALHPAREPLGCSLVDLVSRPMVQDAPALQIRRRECSQLPAMTFRNCAWLPLLPSACITFCITKLALPALSRPRGQGHRVRIRCTYLSFGQGGASALPARLHSPAYTCASACRCLRTAEKPGHEADHFPMAATWSS